MKERDERTGKDAAAQRIANQADWVEQQLRVARERGDFDNLPGFGKPIESLGAEHDPDWWLKQLVDREKIAVLPPALQIRKDDAELDALLDKQTSETGVRRELDDFNERVRRARIQPLGGPPMITQERDVEAELEAWRDRREQRRAAQREALRQAEASATSPRRRGGWGRRRRPAGPR